MPALITGGSGKLGKELQVVYREALFPARKELDITNQTQVISYIKRSHPRLIIHAAAITSVRSCEKNKRLAWQTNIEGTKNLAAACNLYNPKTYFVYISTPCVFYGDSSFYTELDNPYPKNYYSLTKLLSEIVVQGSRLKNWLILRPNFISKAPWPYSAAFADRFGTYLFADDVAMAINEIIQSKMKGTVHICGDRKMSMYEVAKIVSPKVKKMTLKNYDGPPLTIDMSLSSKRWKKYKMSSL